MRQSNGSINRDALLWSHPCHRVPREESVSQLTSSVPHLHPSPSPCKPSRIAGPEPEPVAPPRAPPPGPPPGSPPWFPDFDFDLPDFPWWGGGEVPDVVVPTVPPGVPLPANLSTLEGMFQRWIGLFHARNSTVDPEAEALRREPMHMCSMPAVDTAAERATALLVALRDHAPTPDDPSFTSNVWSDAVRLELGEDDPSKLILTDLERLARALADRRAEVVDHLPVLSRIIAGHGTNPVLPASLRQLLLGGARNFSFWLDEFGGLGSRVPEVNINGVPNPCAGLSSAEREQLLASGTLGDATYWADGESVALHAAQHLIGQTLIGEPFAATCRAGQEQAELGAARLRYWLDIRLSPSMGLSSLTHDRSIAIVVGALTAVADFSEDEELVLRVRLALDVLLHELSVQSVRGTLPINQGERTAGLGGYSQSSNLIWLVAGQGTCVLGEPSSASLALSMLRGGYSVPRVISESAAVIDPVDRNLGEGHYYTRTRSAATASVAGAREAQLDFGLNALVEHCEYWMSVGGSTSPATVECPCILSNAYGDANGPLKAYAFLKPLAGIVLPSAPTIDLGWLPGGSSDVGDAARRVRRRSREERRELQDDDEDEIDSDLQLTLLGGAARLVQPISRGMSQGTSHVYTWRLPGAVLTSVLDYEPGALGSTFRRPWAASLDPAENAVVFTSQPSKPLAECTPHEWWSTQASLPRMAQFESTTIAIYNPPLEVSALLPFVEKAIPPAMTHAYFNRSSFDEYALVVARDDAVWHCGRKGTGYVALHSHRPAAFASEGDFTDADLIAEGYRNVWITHIGDASTDGSFAQFKNDIRRGWTTVDILPPGLDRDGGLPFCLAQNDCIQGFPDAIDYWELVKCVQWVPFINPSPPCDETLNTLQFIGCFLGCDLPDWRLCLAKCAVEAIDWSLPSATFGRVHVEWRPWWKKKLIFGWDEELLVGRRYNAVRQEPYRQLNPRLDTPFSLLEFGRNDNVLDVWSKGFGAHLDFGTPAERTLVDDQ
mmetsp:Transcript_17223/g.53330  ORF Transcript_17223/g.53330 Transcript_17223/m.53330 type:complete len:1006 (-) Transcript_17223:109-3126(-)